MLMPLRDTLPNVEEDKFITVLLSNVLPIAEERKYVKSLLSIAVSQV
jgi:hypothetical protein